MHQKKKIRGYVAHIYDNTNFDIDLGDIDGCYARAIHQTYKYVDAPNNYLSQVITTQPKDDALLVSVGKAYRCRIKGVGVKKNINCGNYFKMIHAISHYINQCNGWVDCTLYGLDKYDRILITMHIPTTMEKTPICLSEYLFAQDPTSIRYYRYDN